MSVLKVLLEAPILTQSGYGVHSRLVFESIKDNSNLEIHIAPLQWGTTSWITNLDPVIENGIRKFHEYHNLCKQANKSPEYDIQIHVGIPNEFEKKARYSVMVTAGIETDRVSWSWIAKSHQGIDKIIVPSEHSRNTYAGTTYEVINNNNNTKSEISCGCPVVTVPYPVREIEAADMELDFETDFNFLNIGLLGPRKNIENCVRWFLKEFKNEENVGLVLKVGLSKGTQIDRQATLDILRNVIKSEPDRKCKIYLLHGNLTESEIRSLYLHPKIKALVTTTHGEGFGLPIFEAAFTGMPVVATDWSAHLDFLQAKVKKNGKEKNKKLFAKVDFKLGEIPKQVVWKDILVEGSKWAYPEELSFKKQIRAVYKNYNMYQSWAKTLKGKILESHSLNNILEKMSNEILEDLPGDLTQRLLQENQNNDVVVFE